MLPVPVLNPVEEVEVPESLRLYRLIRTTLVSLIIICAMPFEASAQVESPGNTTVAPSPAQRGWLGILFAQMDTFTAQVLDSPTKTGTLVLRVFKGSPAEKAGLAMGDIVTSLDHTPIRTIRDLQSLTSGFKPGMTISLDIVRGNKRIHRKVLLTVRDPALNLSSSETDVLGPNKVSADARALLGRLLVKGPDHTSPYFNGLGAAGHIRSATFTPSHMNLDVSGHAVHFGLANLKSLGLNRSVWGSVTLLYNKGASSQFSIQIGKHYPFSDIVRIQKAFLTLFRVMYPPPLKNDPDFKRVAEAYVKAKSKPAIPDQVHMYQVQAADAVRTKHFMRAADLYELADEVAPWWPEGHFNRALIFGQLRFYKSAIGEMQRYIALMPHAPNLSAVKDKIYIWQGRLAEQSSSGGS